MCLSQKIFYHDPLFLIYLSFQMSKIKLPLAIVGTVGACLLLLSTNNAKNESSFLGRPRRRLSLSFQQPLSEFIDPKSINIAVHKEQSTASSKPNILFLLLDQWRPDWDGHHPETSTGPLPLNMPFLQEMGKRGTRFTQAYVPSPFCGPSRACVASGKEYDATGVLTNKRWDVQFETVYKLLRDAGGYHTMTSGKDDLYDGDHAFPKYTSSLNYPHLDVGFSDAIRSDGKTRVTTNNKKMDEPYRKYLDGMSVSMLNGTVVNARAAYAACMLEGPSGENACDASSFREEIYPDDFVRDRAIDLLNRKPKANNNDGEDKPWFLQVNFPGPHHPIVSTSKMAASVIDRVWPDPIDRPGGMNCPLSTPEGAAVIEKSGGIVPPSLHGRCNYAAELEHLDMLMHSVVKQVEELGELDNTIIIVAGDHGENLGDNGVGGKGMPWHASVATPLFISGPGISQGRVHDGPVTTLDLGGTWLDYAGVNALAEGMTTMSLRPLISEPVARSLMGRDEIDTLPRRPFVSSGYVDWRMVVKEMPTSPEDPTITSYKLICCQGKEYKTRGGEVLHVGCKGAPRSALPYPGSDPFQIMLYDTIRDPDDLIPLELARPDLVQELVPLLPEGWCGGGTQGGIASLALK